MTAGATASAGGSGALTFRLKAAARRALRARKGKRIGLRIAAAPPTGPASHVNLRPRVR